MSVGLSIHPSKNMTTTYRISIVPKLTGCVRSTEAREEKTEGLRTRLNGARRVDNDAKVLLVQLVPTVKECFRNLLDLVSILLVGAS